MPFCQDLESMVRSFVHDGEDTVDELCRHPFVKEITHAVDENCPGGGPAKGLFQPFWPQPQIEPLFIWMPCNATETFRKSQGVTVFAAWRHLVTACHRVPGHFRPFDRSLVHDVVRQPISGFDARMLLQVFAGRYGLIAFGISSARCIWGRVRKGQGNVCA